MTHHHSNQTHFHHHLNQRPSLHHPSQPQTRSNWRFLLPVIAILLIVVAIILLLSPWSQRSSENSTNSASSENPPLSNQTSPNTTDSGQTDPNGTQSGQDPLQSNPDSNLSNPNRPTVSGNCTEYFGLLMLINPNFTVNQDFIAARKTQLISISQTYGIPEYNRAGNGDNLLLPEAAAHLNDLVSSYKIAYPGHELGTYSCFRARGTSCGRLCAATGASDHHTGLTCDLIDLQYGSTLDTDDYPNHLEWQWLRENSYKYGFIDRFPEAWAGGPMSEPLNVDANGSTGLYETWHYRYVGIDAATDIATGKYNQEHYDSLEHYLKSTHRIRDLKSGLCQ